MTYQWYKLFLLPEFLATGLVSRTLQVDLENVGQKDILITRGNETGVVYEDTFLVVGMGEENPFERDDIAVYLDSDQYVWLGVNPQ